MARTIELSIENVRSGRGGPFAAIVVKDGRTAVGCDELIEWSRNRMAGFKVPRFVEFLDELPLNATGKVMKDRLR